MPGDGVNSSSILLCDYHVERAHEEHSLATFGRRETITSSISVTLTDQHNCTYTCHMTSLYVSGMQKPEM